MPLDISTTSCITASPHTQMAAAQEPVSDGRGDPSAALCLCFKKWTIPCLDESRPKMAAVFEPKLV